MSPRALLSRAAIKLREPHHPDARSIQPIAVRRTHTLGGRRNANCGQKAKRPRQIVYNLFVLNLSRGRHRGEAKRWGVVAWPYRRATPANHSAAGVSRAVLYAPPETPPCPSEEHHGLRTGGRGLLTVE
ncbi:hypothetical protein GWI33_015510 [Rhynchophorus ferrugineus]|uniref:Uncharacterized protein n=1 Tax=Rhynchophorus ferrugineus TaxID=354439 RepID=A0A834M4F9_RHYFE|nr:hypothetical protein GWI33_015510 [Rhynchophorus ferrugineus]